MQTHYILISVFLLFLSLKIISSFRKSKIFKYIITPATTVILIILAVFYLKNNITKRYTFFILSGLIFSLFGDIINMFEREDNKQLLFSIVFFSITHIFYLFGFSLYFKFSFIILFFAVVILISAVFSYNLFKVNLNTKLYRVTLIFYMIIISITILIGIGTLYNNVNPKTILITTGITLFYISDFYLGYDAFYRKLKYPILIVWGFYGPAQLLITLSCNY